MIYKKVVKPLFDFFCALLGLILFSPLFVIVFICLFVINKGKPFFIQNRPGRNGKIFKIFKFKTMNDITDVKGELLPDSARLSWVGIFLRKTSIDELPQLINVVMGDMSLIGPRPLLVHYLNLYNVNQARRHEVKPGITGWAQVNGRNSISWQQRFDYDVWYVDNISFMLDVKIIFLTVKKVISRVGVSSPTSVTMEQFKGN